MAINGASGNLTGVNAQQNQVDSASGGAVVASGLNIYNGTSYDRSRAANSAAATTGTGLLGAGTLGIYNSTAPTVSSGNFERMQLDAAANLKVYLATTLNSSLDSITISGGLMPTGTALSTYEAIISTNTTTTPTASTVYVLSIVLTVTTAGTTSTITIQDGQATPQILVNALPTTTLSTTPTILSFQSPIKLTTGIKVITAGGSAATVAVWINYYQ
jgi:hypothetical protein